MKRKLWISFTVLLLAVMLAAPVRLDARAAGRTSLKKAVVTVKAITYTGKKRTPAPVVKLAGKKLKKGADYTVSYKNNIKAGRATVTIKGKGRYSGTVSKRFTIKKASMSLKTAFTSLKEKECNTGHTYAIKAKAGKPSTYTYKTSNAKVARVVSGEIEIVGAGKAQITVKATPKNKNYAVKTKKITVTVSAGSIHIVKEYDYYVTDREALSHYCIIENTTNKTVDVTGHFQMKDANGSIIREGEKGVRAVSPGVKTIIQQGWKGVSLAESTDFHIETETLTWTESFDTPVLNTIAVSNPEYGSNEIKYYVLNYGFNTVHDVFVYGLYIKDGRVVDVVLLAAFDTATSAGDELDYSLGPQRGRWVTFPAESDFDDLEVYVTAKTAEQYAEQFDSED